MLLDHEDARTQEIVAKILQDDGVNVILDCDIHRFIQNGSGETEIYYSSGNKELNVNVDAVFISVGKLPNV